jgi:predicted nuclease with RNAse H fold
MSFWVERFCGIDYGTKLSGNTALTYQDNTGIQVLQCPKNTDADQWIITQVTHLNLEIIYLDAPLSLPGGFLGYNDQFHYRASDLELGAMSPMFLGGLTARAISLTKRLEKQNATAQKVPLHGAMHIL